MWQHIDSHGWTHHPTRGVTFTAGADTSLIGNKFTSLPDVYQHDTDLQFVQNRLGYFLASLLCMAVSRPAFGVQHHGQRPKRGLSPIKYWTF